MKRRSIFLACAFAGALLSQPVSAESLIRIGSPYRTTTLDPIRSTAAGNIEAFGQLYARLLRKDEAGKVQPGLASAWTISEDGLELVFTLRAAKFSDGRLITAEDVAFSLTRALKDEKSVYAATLAAVESVRVQGDATVKVRLKHRFAPILDNLEVFNAGIVSKADVEARGEMAFSEKPVTSGPYQVREWRPNDRLVLEPNPNYWREGYPKNDGAELIEVENSNTRVSMLMSGELDAMRDVPWAQLEAVKARDSLLMALEPSTVIYMTLLNERRPPFDNIKVRQAAAHALNIPAIAKAMTAGNGMPANTTLPAALDYHAKNLPGIAYDPALAQMLLSEGGYDGKELTMLISANADAEKLATLLQAQWAAIGLKTKIEKVDRGVWWERIPAGDYDLAPSWWYNETSDPDLAVRWAVCGTCETHSFHTHYDNPKVNALTEEAVRELDPARRGALYHEIQKISTEEVAQIPLYYPPYANAYAKAVDGLRLSPSLQWSLEDAVLAK
ncbi:peptide ABC transporter substrate-binding protein [Shinella sp. SUS2]|uniref:ABC transporter substrate-binding protein n=1 Tax=unclassified Shinella TaxID=2643062 RepID=UPI000680E6DF|nr:MULTISPECIES: ABC transporter substrate-binding protein [unclassified Shinella]KNY13554.1 peptide ABC transporter substrate-binding protein [Shinella sp. SUS2]KOC72349.1 peptide ABC transporter substrate-binding protein [Shinella sp. GWS1]